MTTAKVGFGSLAESADQIRERYPELEVVENPPPSMTEEQLEDIKARRTLDIDDDVDPFLLSLRKRGNDR